MSDTKYRLPREIFNALKAGVHAHGNRIGTGRLFNLDGSPYCILGHAAVVDGLSPIDANRVVYGPELSGGAGRPATPTMQALYDAGIGWMVNDRAVRPMSPVTFDEWCELVGVGIAEEVAHV